MTAVPMTLEDTLLFNGLRIVPAVAPAHDIVVPTGTIHVPEMVLSSLVGDGGPIDIDFLGHDLYLSHIPLFHDDYKPVVISHILDRFRKRRLAYDTPDEWMLAFRRWVNLNMPLFNLRYLSTAVELPLDTQAAMTQESGSATSNESGNSATDATMGSTTNQANHGRNVASDFPQSQLAGNTDYATNATDSNSTDQSITSGDNHSDTADSRETSSADQRQIELSGRTGRSVADLLMEQRAAYLNVDAELMEAMEDLFLQLFNQGEWDASPHQQPHFVW